jgi:hypothetical protein
LFLIIPVAIIPAELPLITRKPSTIEPSPLRLTPVPIKEIDPFRTAIPSTPLAPIAVAKFKGLKAVPLIVKPARSTVTKLAVICKQVPPVAVEKVRSLTSLYEPG